MLAPKNWKVVGTEESMENLKKIKFTDEQLESIAKSKNGIISQTTYYKYDTDKVQGFIPTVKIIVRLNPSESFDEFQSIIIATTEKLKSVLSGFEIIEPVENLKISNQNSIYYSCKYSITPVSSDEFKLRTRSYNIPRGRYFLSITLMDNESNEDCSSEFMEIIKTKRFE
jgi:hypothetical protein